MMDLFFTTMMDLFSVGTTNNPRHEVLSLKKSSSTLKILRLQADYNLKYGHDSNEMT